MPDPKHCWNCGQPVADKETAKKASTIGVVFCCECGTQLDPSGRCRNHDCKYFAKIPKC
jgi:hypothetical protein